MEIAEFTTIEFQMMIFQLMRPSELALKPHGLETLSSNCSSPYKSRLFAYKN